MRHSQWVTKSMLRKLLELKVAKAPGRALSGAAELLLNLDLTATAEQF